MAEPPTDGQSTDGQSTAGESLATQDRERRAPETVSAAVDHERAERLLVAARLEDAQGARYLLVRWPDWPYPALLSLAKPRHHDSLEEAVATLLLARLRLRCQGPPRTSPVRVPVRLAHPRFGGQGLGWVRPVAVSVVGEPEPDALLEGVQALPLQQALEALPTEVERTVLREAAKLFPGETTAPDETTARGETTG